MGKPGHKSQFLMVRVEAEDLLTWQKAAKRAGLTLSEWVRRALNAERDAAKQPSDGAAAWNIPPLMAADLDKLVADYAAATGQSAEDCRRLVELGVFTRGVRMMAEQVEVERRHAERMGWT